MYTLMTVKLNGRYFNFCFALLVYQKQTCEANLLECTWWTVNFLVDLLLPTLFKGICVNDSTISGISNSKCGGQIILNFFITNNVRKIKVL